MPRDSSGNYTLPAGNPVVTDTDIEAVWANTTLGDIALQLNGVVTRDGLLGPTAPLKLQNGTLAAPGLAFNAAPSTGMYRASSFVGFAWLGAQKMRYSASGVNITGSLVTSGEGYFSALYATNPTATIGVYMSFDTVRNSGYFVGQNSLDFYTSISSTVPVLALENEKAFFGLPNDFLGTVQVNIKGDILIGDPTALEGLYAGYDPVNSGGYVAGIGRLNLYADATTLTTPAIALLTETLALYAGNPIGWGNAPAAASSSPTAADAGKTIYATGTVNIGNSVFAAHDVLYIVNTTGGAITVTGPTTFWTAGTATNGAKTLAQHDMAKVVFISPTEAIYKA